MMGFSYEKRALKRPKLGPPDVYPQHPKQKEDELTPGNVKHGFTSSPQLPNNDEFGSAHDCNLSASKIGAYLNAILLKKEEINTLSDTGRKRQQINIKENFWPATARTKNAVDAWFKDLAGSKALSTLSKRAPNFNKKEEMFVLLCEYQVPVLRASWFIKLSSAYTVAVSEQKIKKRQLPDPTQEWTSTLLKFMKEQLIKLQEFYQNQSPAVVQTVQGGASAADEQRLAMRQWQYCTLLAKHMYQEGLMERQEVLQWILDLLERLKSPSLEDGLLRPLLALTLQYLHEFVQSEQLSRRLVNLCARKISHLHAVAAAHILENQPPTPQSPNQPSPTNPNGMVPPINANNPNDPAPVLSEYLKCSHHRDMLISLSTIIQVVTLECPTALVWNNVGEGKSFSILNGSPLDHLPCNPASLPMPQRSPSLQIRSQLRLAEELIRQRSAAAMSRWSSDKWQQSSAGIKMQKILNTLDALDRHSFDRVDQNNSIDTLYNNIFPPIPEKTTATSNSNSNSNSNSGNQNQNKFNKTNSGLTGNNQPEDKKDSDIWQDEAIVHILCEWAISHLRTGEHRAIAVARLLEKRQSEILNPGLVSTSVDDLPDEEDSAVSLPVPFPIFQPVLMNYLDHLAPTTRSDARFTNLVHLFSQLIRNDMFSHDAYMCTLISRGDLNTSSVGGGANEPNSQRNMKSIDGPGSHFHGGSQMQLDDDTGFFDIKPTLNEQGRVVDYDESKIDEDLDKLLQSIKQEQQNTMDCPDSPKVEPGSLVGNHLQSMSHDHHRSDQKTNSSRHHLYATHFPLPLDDESSNHDCNQRYVLLFGVGKQRDDSIKKAKKISKDICKLFSKKFLIDVGEGGKVKKHSRSEFNFQSITELVQKLSYFDQHVVTYQCSQSLIESINVFATGNSNYLPVQEHVAFLFDLMELSLNVDGLIDLCITILKEIPGVEEQLIKMNSPLTKVYISSLILYILGVLRRYHSCLLMSQEQTTVVFERVFKIVKCIPNPGECASFERCIFSHLYDFYTSAAPLLKTLPNGCESFPGIYLKIRQTVCCAVSNTPSNHCQWDPSFMAEAIMNYRRGTKIDPSWIKQLNELPMNRYSLVCNVIITLCTKTTDVDRLNDLGIFCAELTAACNTLTSEWLGVLMALCCSSNHPSYFGDVLSLVDVQDLSIHNSLAIFTAILVARNCIGLEDFVVHVALPSLVIVCNDGRRDADADAEAGARLTCHLLLRLFKTNEVPQPALYSVGTSPHPMVNHNAGFWCIKQSCDRHLLAAMHNNIRVEALIAVLKAIIVVGDVTAPKPGPTTKKSPSGHQTPNHSGKINNELLSHILGTSDVLGGSSDILDLGNGSCSEASAPNLSEFAQFVLKEICNQEWVLNRCLQNPEMLCRSDMLLDQMLNPKLAQKLLHMICYPEIAASTDNCFDHKSIISNIIQKLDQWTLRMSCLDMQLMFKQFKENSTELNQWLDMVAKAAINVFQQTKGESKVKQESIWLVAPLISKLPSAIQGRVLKVAGQVLENINVSNNTSSNNSTSSGGGGSSSRSSSKGTPQHQHQHTQQQKSPAVSQAPLVHHQPFLSLVLTCLKEQDDQRETLLASLHSQLSQFLNLTREERINPGKDYFCGRSEDGLLLRFSLVGGMFDTIQRSTFLTTDWAVLFVQLITHGVVDNSNNTDLFSTVIDMLATLIHSTLVSDSQNEKGEENRRHYQNLMKKLKKEVGDKKSLSVGQVRQLLPLPKQQCEVIATEPIGCITDNKGNKIAGFDSLDKKEGLHVIEKQRVSTWDILEGHKNPAPLSWAWFSAVRMERKPLWYEENHRLLKYHTHSLVKPSSYFLEPLPLPPEDMEPSLEKQMKSGPAGVPEPSSVEQSPGGRKRGMKQGTTIRRKKQAAAKPAVPGPMPPMHQGAVPGQHMNYPGGGPPPGPPGPGNGNMYPCQPGPNNGPQWGNYPQQAGHMGPQQPAPPYYPHQMPSGGPGNGRFDRPLNQSKQALSNMLQRRTVNQFMGMQQQNAMNPHGFHGMQRQQFIRQQIRAQQQMQPSSQPPGPGPMFSNAGPGPGPGPGPGQQQIFPNMPPGMNQNYAGYGNQPPTSQQQSQMMAAAAAAQQQQQQQQQMPVNNPPSSMYQQQQQQHLQQQQQQQQQQQNINSNPPFNMRQQQEFQQQRVRSPYLAPNVTMNTMGNQPPAPPYSRPVAPPQQNAVNPQQQQQQFQHMSQQQQRMRQHIMAMQQQQQHQQQQQQLAQLQRQMQNNNQPPQNPYSMQPPPY